MKKTAWLLLIIGMATTMYAQTEKSWKGKKCAVVLTYDDAIDQHLDNALPVLEELGLKASFYLTAFSDACQHRLSEWRLAAQRGYELGNHTLFHPCAGGTKGREWVAKERDLNDYTPARMINEIRMTNVFLEALDGKTKRTFAFTCGDTRVRDSFFMNAMHDDFIAARTVVPGLQTIGEIDPYAIGCYTISGQSAEEMIAYVKKAMESNTLLVFLFHGVGGGNGLDVTVENHRALLEYLKKNEKDIWIAPMIDVAEFIRARQKK